MLAAEVRFDSKLIVFKAEARSKKGKLIATSTSHSLIAKDESLKRELRMAPR
jgi:hypothetical protein